LGFKDNEVSPKIAHICVLQVPKKKSFRGLVTNLSPKQVSKSTGGYSHIGICGKPDSIRVSAHHAQSAA
jgi:hypothetical protein